MRVRISYTIDVDDDFREEINRYYGRPGKASREEVQRWFRANGESMNDDLAYGRQVREQQDEDAAA